MLLGQHRHGVEQPAGQGQPGAHRRAAVGPELWTACWAAKRVADPSAPCRRRRGRGERRGTPVGAGHHGEPGPVDDLVDGGRGRELGRLQLGPPHRAGRVDDDDLPRVTGAALAGGPGPGARDCDDRVHVGAAVGQELVLVDRGGELSHGPSSFVLFPPLIVQYAVGRTARRCILDAIETENKADPKVGRLGSLACGSAEPPRARGGRMSSAESAPVPTPRRRSPPPSVVVTCCAAVLSWPVPPCRRPVRRRRAIGTRCGRGPRAPGPDQRSHLDHQTADRCRRRRRRQRRPVAAERRRSVTATPGVALRLGGPLAVGQIANTDIGPTIGVLDPDGFETVSYLATEFDLLAFPNAGTLAQPGRRHPVRCSAGQHHRYPGHQLRFVRSARPA